MLYVICSKFFALEGFADGVRKSYLVVLYGWLGGFGGKEGRLLTIEEVGEILKGLFRWNLCCEGGESDVCI